MKKLALVFAVALVSLPSIVLYAQKVQALHQLDQIKQIKTNHEGQIYLFSDYEVCLLGADGIETECYALEEKIKDYIGIGTYSALAVKNLLKIYKGNELHKEIQLSEEINVLAYFKERIFIGTSGSGLYVYSIDNDHLDSLKGIELEFINDILLMDSSLWLAMDHGISIYSAQSLQLLHSIELSNQLINRLMLAGKGNIYAIGLFGDFYLFDAQLKQLQHKKLPLDIQDASYRNGSNYILTSNACYKIGQALELEKVKEGKFSALCVLDNQLLLAKDNSIISLDITQKKIPLNDNCFSIYAVNDHDFWVGAKGKIHHFVNDSHNATIDLPLPDQEALSVSALYVSDKYIFAGTMGDGLFVLDHDGIPIKHLLVKSDNNQKNIIQMKAHENKLWIVYLTGIITLDMNTMILDEKHSNIIGNNYLYCLELKSEDEFYVGTSVHGLIHFKSGKMEEYLPENTIFSINKWGDSLVVSTESNGVFIVSPNGKQVEGILELDKVFNSTVFNDGLLLIARENEVILYHSKSKNQFVLPDIGLRNMQFNSFSSSENYFFLGFGNGILKLDKEKLKNLGEIKTYLNAPKLFDESVSMDHQNFSSDENTFTFSFQSFSYYRSKNTIYKYRLIGLDSNWQNTTQEFVNYYNLPHGNYTFEVAAGTSENFIPQDSSQYSFSISKPFWLQPVFIVLSSLLIILLVYFLVKSREKQIVAKGKAEQEHLRFEFDQLKSQVDPHFLFNSLNSITDLIEEDPPMAVQAVVKLSNVYRSILEYGKVDTVDLETELKLAQQYFEIHKMRYQHLIELDIHGFENGSVYRLVPLSCQFLIENAIKHNQISKRKKLVISIYLEGNYLVVKNNLNRKEQQTASTSLGLINLKRRYAQLSKNKVQIIENNEIFTVKLPLIYG